MPQEQHLRRVATMSISSLSIARRPVQQRNRAQELLAIRAELAEARMSLREEKARSARLEQSASQLAVAQLATAGHDLRDLPSHRARAHHCGLEDEHGGQAI